MKCYFTWDEKHNKKVLIPECWPVVNSGDINDCNCKFDLKTEYDFSQDRFNKKLKEKDEIIIKQNEEIIFLQKQYKKIVNQLDKLKNENNKNIID
jgi:hypothetical protein